ncbi:hypothetical protein M406DRAFT_358490 [Cryphonectria parasitica EP155]|uniref:Uncharacterized protein n=1 Tax=Cryphonectria parasitica (strain ATCC 38755 / EP155) TaxID=660469 RepID=A0A9P4XTU4_CRYP1|nr:uncharacterized protein M406DRAFT_358490 [Cryphonectria parasitica EP155]KAF3761137.1 hypothetical protein M406DRAFT_358490 [Cryphonectria parasitica EP155]
MPEPTCKICNEPLLVPVETDSDDDDGCGQPGPSTSSLTAETVPDDLEFPCGCHFHWQCALDESRHIAFHLTCPSCGAHLVSNAPGPSVTNPVFHISQAPVAILCQYTSDGGVEENHDILPVLTEEAYLASHPGERRPRAFLTMCGEGDVLGAVDLLKDAASEGDDVKAIVLYRDALQRNRSALQIALEKSQEEAVWLLLYLGSPRLPDEAFPEEALVAARSMGVDRMPAGHGGEDITAVKDEEGRSAEDYARAMAPLWDRLVNAGVLRP